MRVVRLTRSGWWDDEVNGDAGRPLTLTDAKAYEIVEVWKSAVYIDGAPSPKTVMEHPPELAEAFTVPREEPRPAEPEDPASALKMPWTNAPKDDWVEWAVRGNHGGPAVTAQEAARLTKNQLMSRYGERL
jgi:hypothetical protein